MKWEHKSYQKILRKDGALRVGDGDRGWRWCTLRADADPEATFIPAWRRGKGIRI
jgi:hypothetical protein